MTAAGILVMHLIAAAADRRAAGPDELESRYLQQLKVTSVSIMQPSPPPLSVLPQGAINTPGRQQQPKTQRWSADGSGPGFRVVRRLWGNLLIPGGHVTSDLHLLKSHFVDFDKFNLKSRSSQEELLHRQHATPK